MTANVTAEAGKAVGGISGFTLKMIALVTMFLDHLGAAVVQRCLENPLPFMEGKLQAWYYFYVALRCIGRMAFPIYCFLLVEGFHYTRSRWKYALRLFIFALISDLPFDLAFNYSWFDFTSNNVFWTLLIGLLVIWGTEFVWIRIGHKRTGNKEESEEDRAPAKTGPGRIILCIFISMVLLAAGMALAQYGLFTDYGAAGVATIFVMYALRRNRILAYGLGVLALTALTYSMAGLDEILSILMLIPIAFYRGRRGPKMNKYFFYAFYPAHLLMWVGVCALLGLKILA